MPDLIASHPAGEGIVKRAKRDTAQAAHSLWFVGAEVVAAGACGTIAALLLADAVATTVETALITFAGIVTGLLVVLLVIFLWSLLRAPFRQRDEARAEITPGFPRYALEVGSPLYSDIDVESRMERIILLDIVFANRESQQRMSLDFELETVADYGNALAVGPFTLSESNRGKTANRISSPQPVEPQTTIKGHLLFDAFGAVLLDFEEDGMAVWPQGHARIILRIIDQVSGGVIEQSVQTRPKPTEAAQDNSAPTSDS